MTALPKMPRRIAALPRDRRGYPVPHVSLWSADPDDGVPIATIRTVVMPNGQRHSGHVVADVDRQGVGTPMLGAIAPGRQLEAHEHARCNVCAGEVFGVLTFVGGTIEDPARQHYTEAPLHRACARWALQVCPALLTARRTEGLTVSEVMPDAVRYTGLYMGADDDQHELPLVVGFEMVPLVLVAVQAWTAAGRLTPADVWLAG